jgi:ABC-type nitrate/sulfonate/bicarbonate transport system permease component
VRTRANLAGWFFVAFVAALLEVGVRAFDLQDSVPTVSATVRALVDEIASGELLDELATTLRAYAEGFVLATLAGVALGVAIGSSRTLRDASFVLIEFLRPIPGVALVPLAILFFGLGLPARRFVVAYATLWPILVNTLYGVRGVDTMLNEAAAVSGVTRIRRLVRVTLPAALPSIVTGIRIGASIALLVVVTAEFVIGTDGLGAYMQRQQLAYRLPELYAAVVLVGLLGYAINVGLRSVERRTVFWIGEERQARR